MMTICVGTVGGGVHVSPDGGGRWTQVFKPVPPEGNVRALRVDPNDQAHLGRQRPGPVPQRRQG